MSSTRLSRGSISASRPSVSYSESSREVSKVRERHRDTQQQQQQQQQPSAVATLYSHPNQRKAALEAQHSASPDVVSSQRYPQFTMTTSETGATSSASGGNDASNRNRHLITASRTHASAFAKEEGHEAIQVHPTMEEIAAAAEDALLQLQQPKYSAAAARERAAEAAAAERRRAELLGPFSQPRNTASLPSATSAAEDTLSIPAPVSSTTTRRRATPAKKVSKRAVTLGGGGKSSKSEEEKAKEVLGHVEVLLKDCPNWIEVRSPHTCHACCFVVLFSGAETMGKYLVPVVRMFSEYTTDGLHHGGGSKSTMCFLVEAVPIDATTTSLHVTVRPEEAPAFYQRLINRMNKSQVGSIDLPYPPSEVMLTDAQCKRLLYIELNQVVRDIAKVPSSEPVILFPAHVDTIRDAIWESMPVIDPTQMAVDAPEDDIFAYFGEETMFYFAWMNHYKRWLAGASVAALFTTLVARQGGYTMHNNPLIPTFVVVIVLGSVLCVKMWERRCSTLMMKYHLFVGETLDEPRREFKGTMGVDPITGRPQLQYPVWKRGLLLQPIAWLIISAFAAFTGVVMLCFLNMEGMVPDETSLVAMSFFSRLAEPGGILCKAEHPYAGMIPSLAYSVVISILSRCFSVVAEQLTAWENYQYRGEFAQALMQKRVLFEFVNSYSKLFFIAFIRRNMEELSSAIQTTFVMAAFIRLLTETLIPFVTTHRAQVMRQLKFWRRKDKKDEASGGKVAEVMKKVSKHGGDESSTLDQVDEKLDDYTVYSDFVEMAIQFGYIGLFAAAFPLAAVVALFSNFIEMRSDLFKLCYVVRRPVPRLGLKETKAWCGILRVFALTSVITNIFLLTLTTDHMARIVPARFCSGSGKAGGGGTADAAVAAYAALLEHIVMVIVLFISWRVSSIPHAVRVYTQKMRYIRSQNHS